MNTAVSRSCLAICLIATVSLLCSGCGDSEPAAPKTVTLETLDRLVRPQAIHPLQGEEGVLWEQRVAFEWDLSDPGEQERWTSDRRSLSPAAAARSVGTRESTVAVTLSRDTVFEAGTVDILDVRFAGQGLARDSAILLWAPKQATAAANEGILVRGVLAAAGQGRTFRFEVGGHPGWQGEIGRISIRVFPLADRGPVLDRVTARRRVLPESALVDATRDLRLNLADEIRSSILALPGLDIERRLDLPRGARLRLGWGVHGAPEHVVRFQVLGAVEDGEPELLFEAALEPGPDIGRWHSGEVALAPLFGRSSRLILRTVSDGPLDPAVVIPAWAHPEIVAPARTDRPNVLLISADTLRADRLSVYGHDRATSPRLETWAARSATVFRQAVASSPWTLPSHASMLTGLEAHRHGVMRDPVPPSLETLAETLRAAGYFTAAITGGGFLHPRFGFSQGFDRYRFHGPRSSAGNDSAPDAQTELDESLARAESLLDDLADRPFFLFFHTFEVHQPYQAREPWFSRFSRLPRPAAPIKTPRQPRVPEEGFRGYGSMDLKTDQTVELLRDLYDSSVAFLDDRIDRLLSALEERGLSDRTIVVFTSDHGEMLGERGLAGHYYLWDENIMVPLMISVPGDGPRALEVREQVRLVDIHPTLLELLGLPIPEGLDGASLVPLLENRGGGHREALTYAGTSNQGIGVRMGGRRKYVLDNTAWPPYSGAELAYFIDTDREIELPDSALTELAPLRGELLRRLADESPGINLTLVNNSDNEIRGTAESALVRTSSVKAIELSCDCVSWSSIGELSFRVPPGERVVLKIEGLRRHGLELRIEAAEAGSEAFEALLVPDPDGTPTIVELAGAEWSIGPDVSSPSRAAVSVSWTGPVGDEAPLTTPEADPELLERLRALGYID